MKGYSFITLLFFFMMACSPKPITTGWDTSKDDSRALLQYQLGDSLYQTIDGRQVKRRDRRVRTKKDALQLGMPALIKEYGKEDAEGRNYDVHLIHGYWIVRGILPPGFTGGMLVAVIDAESGDLLHTLVWT